MWVEGASAKQLLEGKKKNQFPELHDQKIHTKCYKLKETSEDPNSTQATRISST